MNTLKFIILLGLPMVLFAGSASAQTAIGTSNVASVTGVSGFSGREVNRPAGPGNAFSQSERGAKFEVGVENGSLPSETRYNTGFSVRPGGTPQPATGPVTTSVPGTNSVGTFGSGQTTVTNPNNPITQSSPGTTTIFVGPTGETNAFTPGTSGTTGGTVPGTTTSNPLTPIPGTQSIGVLGSGQTIVTNPGNLITVAPPGTTTIVRGQQVKQTPLLPELPEPQAARYQEQSRAAPCWPLLFPERNPSGSSGAGRPLSLVPGTPSRSRLRGPRQSLWGQQGKQTPLLPELPEPRAARYPGTTTSNPLTPIPGTQSIGVLGSGQTIVTNPGNPITVAPPGTTTIVVGPTGETNAVTPGTSGITGVTVPGGVFPSNSATIASASSAIPGTQSIGVFASGQTVVTNPGNTSSSCVSGHDVDRRRPKRRNERSDSRNKRIIKSGNHRSGYFWIECHDSFRISYTDSYGERILRS